MKSRRSATAASLLSILVVALLPWTVPDRYFLSVLVVCGIYSIYAVSLDLIVGYLGVFSFGHAAFFGVGAYVAGVLQTRYGLSYWATLPAAMAMSAALGLLFTVPALRTRGIYFAITTLACAEITRLGVVSFPELTRGYMGLSVPQPGAPLGLALEHGILFFYLVYLLLLVVCIMVRRFIDSAMGRGLVAIRENESLALSVGIPVLSTTVAVFTVSSALAGLSGALYAGFVGIASPELMSVSYSALALLMVIVGGRGTVWGGIAGAFMFTVVTEFFRVADEMRMVFFSALLIVSMIAMPRGLIAPLLRLASAVKDQPK